MEFLNWYLLPLLPLTLWLLTANLTPSFPTLRGKRILLLIAHPDDEAMFFSPSILALTKPHLGNHLKILCLSTGNADGLGSIRRQELVKSGLLLGVRNESDVLVLDDERFPDSMTRTWDESPIVDLLTKTFVPELEKAKRDGPVKAGIDVLITFDGQGVSGHPNHISLYHGAKAFVRTLVKGREGWDAAVKLYVLPSLGVARKYASILDVPITVVARLLSRKKGGEYPDPLLAISGVGGYRSGQRAMTEAHKSQMRWFRWGWISISRYMVVNDLRREDIK
ncbi:putative deacetylase LmbE-like domain-containing protein [Elsinoe ampelina]|uniref:N-acetylglucosaminylphosphatidylinositol deacetylase n=1 Tax=Elsinoe ampelina TaxID=302913 RepID=A0A6A6GJV7_9PEZI|nr:putative deacetylase LmbE-like domain-containing protein [Elsinoe ampelina]